MPDILDQIADKIGEQRDRIEELGAENLKLRELAEKLYRLVDDRHAHEAQEAVSAAGYRVASFLGVLVRKPE